MIELYNFLILVIFFLLLIFILICVNWGHSISISRQSILSAFKKI